MQTEDYKCPSCSAPLKYNPESGSWKCEYCFSEHTLADLDKNEEKFDDLDSKETIDVDEYTCSNCGAKIVTDENTTATFCVYCGNMSIIKNRLTGMLKPKSVIPFKTTKEEAINSFLKFKKGKPFAPGEFGKKEQIEKLTGVYIPFWLYDCHATGSVGGTGLKVKTWRSGDYRYTKTDTYNVFRSGEAKFIKIPVDGATKFDDDIMDSIEPFNYNEVTEFSPAYLSGFFAEKYDVNSDEAYKRAEKRVETALSDYLKNTILGYTTLNLSNTNVSKDLQKTEYVLFPVWMLNVKYKDKMHMFAMNGQTGKMIGNVPVSWPKFWAWFAGLFITLTLLIGILFNVASASTNVCKRTEEDLKVASDIVITETTKKAILNTPKVDESEKIYDFADLFTKDEEISLYNEVTDYISQSNLDMAIVTIDENPKNSAMNYADDFYDYNYFGTGNTHDGVLFLIDMDTREMWISTTGNAMVMYDDVRIDRILDYTEDEIKNEEYYEGASVFVEKSLYYFEQGKPSSNDNAYVDANGNLYYNHESNETSFFIPVVIAFVVSLVVVLVMKGKHKTIKKATTAWAYMKEPSITGKEDTFITTHTAKTYSPRSSSSGGSASHSGSSGRSHGGGGRSF